jgi:hypothetical protein
MPNGTLKLYNKLTNVLLVSLDILSTFNIEDNLNETPSNMKVKVITSNTYREEFEVNTIAYHEDTNSWWVIKSDESSYLTTGEYEHEIQLVEFLEFYAYRHLPNCAFAPNIYNLEDMLNRLFDIAKLSISVIYPNFLDKDKIMPFFSFENFTVANAIKNISRAINAIPKMSAGNPYELFTGSISFSNSPPSSPSNGDYWFRTDTSVLYQRVDGSWVVVTSSNGTTTPTTASESNLRFVNTATSQLFISQSFRAILTFINRNGLDNAIVNDLNTQFPIAYEKNMNSNDQFTTRSVSNITNAKSSSLVVSPQKGGYKNISIESSTYVADTAKIYLPSKIDSVKQLNIYPRVSLVYITFDGSNLIYNPIYKGYFFDEAFWFQKFEQSLTTTNKIKLYDLTELTVTSTIYNALNALTINDFPTAKEQSLVNSTDTISTTYNDVESPWFQNKMILKSSFDFNLENTQTTKDRISYFEKNTNTITMSKRFREGLSWTSLQSSIDMNPFYKIYRSSSSIVYDSLYLMVDRDLAGLYLNKTFSPNILVQVSYYPIADIKVSIDNDNDAQDEKFFNQSGKVIDAVSVSKLITSHTNDSVEGTKIRNAKYGKFSYKLFTGSISFSPSPPSSPSNGDYWFRIDTNQLYQRISGSWVVVESTNGIITPIFAQEENLKFVNTATQQLFISENFLSSILPLGQLVRDSNQLYVVTQRSIDGQIKDNNEYYNVIYTLSRNRIARSENIVADSSVISYKTPDDNLVFRSQLYKDYIELSLANITPKDTPYLSMAQALVLSSTLAGTNFDYTVLAKNSFGTTPTIVRYVKNPTVFDLHKAKLMNVNWQDNNIIDYRVERDNAQNPIQTPIVYTDSLGKATNFELLFCDTLQIEQANFDYNEFSELDALVPFGDLTQVPTSFYTDDVLADGRFSIRIQEDTSGGKPYQKDPFEIPVFEYMIQGNDDYNTLGNIVIGNDLFTTFTGNIRYHYIINNSTRFTSENAIKLQLANNWSSVNDRRVTIDRSTNTQFDLDLFSNFSTSSRNSTAITNVGIYAVQGGTGVVKFLFAINDYVVSGINDNSNIRVFINNWKI